MVFKSVLLDFTLKGINVGHLQKIDRSRQAFCLSVALTCTPYS